VSEPVLAARFERRSDISAIARAALEVDIVYVALPEAPSPGRHVLQLFVGDELVASVSAELVGSGRDGEFPLRIRLLDPGHRGAVEALAQSAPRAQPSMPVSGPRPRRVSVRLDSNPPPAPEPSQAHAEDRTLTSGKDAPRVKSSVRVAMPTPPPAPRRNTPTPVQPTEEVATTLFDPDSLLRGNVRPNTGSSEDMTIPRSGNLPNLPRDPADSDTFSDEHGTLPGDGTPRSTQDVSVSWNVRIAPTTKDPLCGRAIGGGKYVLESVIGTGAIGIVFKASHRDLGRTVAIKVLNPRYRDDADLLQIFRREARAASQLEHPNVARVYDYGQEPDGLVYIVMEYLSGYTLGSVLHTRKRIAVPRARDLMVQVATALAAAHERGIVHRDVKPDNIVLVPEQDDEGQPVEVVKVCDFGIAALGKAKNETGGYAAGTPEYMAPEQQTGGPVTAAADVYAAGVVLYEMLVGHVPFTDAQAYRILLKHKTEVPEPPTKLVADVPRALEGLVLKCLEKQPERRYANGRDLRTALRKIDLPR
jgi:tRNA A-37 threonylcarbamoyl transferase component Bud32